MLLNKIKQNKLKKNIKKEKEYKEKYTFVGLDRAPDVRKDPLYSHGFLATNKKELLSLMHLDANTESLNRMCNCSFGPLISSSLGRPLTGVQSATTDTIELIGWLAEFKDSKYIDYLNTMEILDPFKLRKQFPNDKDAAVCLWILEESEDALGFNCEGDLTRRPYIDRKPYYNFNYEAMITNAFDYLIAYEHKDIAKRDAMEKEIQAYWTVRAKELDKYLKNIGKDKLYENMIFYSDLRFKLIKKEISHKEYSDLVRNTENLHFYDEPDYRILDILTKYVPEDVLLYKAPKYLLDFDKNLNLNTF